MLLCCVHIRYKNVCHLSSPKVTLGLKHSTLHSSPKAIGRAALNLRYTWAYSSQMAQPDDHPPAGGLLHHLLTLTITPTMEKAGGAVIFFYRHLLSPIASSFGSGMLYAARTFLSHLKDASDRPEHCFRHAKVQKTFDTIARFLTFLCIINYSQGCFSLFSPVKPSFWVPIV